MQTTNNFFFASFIRFFFRCICWYYFFFLHLIHSSFCSWDEVVCACCTCAIAASCNLHFLLSEFSAPCVVRIRIYQNEVFCCCCCCGCDWPTSHWWASTDIKATSINGFPLEMHRMKWHLNGWWFGGVARHWMAWFYFRYFFAMTANERARAHMHPATVRQ